MNLRTEVLVRDEQVMALVPEWDDLALRDPQTTPYDSGTLMTGLGAMTDDAAQPYVVTARTDSGALVGVLPLRRARVTGRLGGHKLIAFSAWHASYFDASIDPNAPLAAEALLAELRAGRDWERCDLQYLRPEGHLYKLGVGTNPERLSNSHFIERTPTIPAEPGQVMAHKSARRLSKAGQIDFIPAVTATDLDTTVRRFAELHTQRWLGHGDSAEFAAPAKVDGLIDTMHLLSTKGIGRVGRLTLDGVTIAVHIAFRWRDAQFSWRMAHDSQWQAMSPGRLLMSLMIEEALSSGSRQYDLGRGDEGYKQLWPTEERPLYRVSIPGLSWRARVAAWRGVVRPQPAA